MGHRIQTIANEANRRLPRINTSPPPAPVIDRSFNLADVPKREKNVSFEIPNSPTYLPNSQTVTGFMSGASTPMQNERDEDGALPDEEADEMIALELLEA